MVLARKLGTDEAADTLVPVGAGAFAPHAILWSPVYLELPRNGRFLVLKATLDFFTAEELERAAGKGKLYVPLNSELASATALAARVKSLLPHGGPDEEFPTPPYVVHRAVTEILAPFGSRAEGMDPFQVAVFAGTLCAPFSPELLEKARDHDVSAYELGLFRAGFATFLALHLGYCDLSFLRALFERTLSLSMGLDTEQSRRAGSPEESEIFALVSRTVREPDGARVAASALSGGEGRIARKLVSAFGGGAHG